MTTFDERTQNLYAQTSVMIELRAQSQMLQIQRQLEDFLDQLFSNNEQKNFVLFTNQAGYSLSISRNRSYVFTDPEHGKTYSPIGETTIEAFLVWCAHFCFPEYPNYLKYNQMLAEHPIPTRPPTLIFFRERVDELFAWVSENLKNHIQQLSSPDLQTTASIQKGLR